MRLGHVITSVVLCGSLVFPTVSYSSTQEPQEEPAAKTAETAPPQKEPPKAKSPEELEAYQKFMQAQDPDVRIREVEDFLLQYPESALKEYAYQVATQVYQAKNYYAWVLTYGELTLSENESNLVALLVLASAIADRTGQDTADRDEKLSEAEQYAKRALEELARMEMPPEPPPPQWEQAKRDAESTAHAALGMIAMVRKDFTKAESELRLASSLAVPPDPVLLYRLGLCYSFQQKYDLALEVLDQAAALGGVKVPSPDGGTKDLVGEAKEFALRAKTGWTEAPVPAPPAPNPEAPTP
ncbi:MAG: hypothetical protein A3G20_01270 [Acidobacteria bacterium RIFCSPLOWO2_12_FULL_59_11]|nr:MAG: hypothetical protein A3G20_01270 [Acidobacteria bacterium RIFCSPLOWO2_12_FULL_59_11]